MFEKAFDINKCLIRCLTTQFLFVYWKIIWQRYFGQKTYGKWETTKREAEAQIQKFTIFEFDFFMNYEVLWDQTLRIVLFSLILYIDTHFGPSTILRKEKVFSLAISRSWLKNLITPSKREKKNQEELKNKMLPILLIKVAGREVLVIQ